MAEIEYKASAPWTENDWAYAGALAEIKRLHDESVQSHAEIERLRAALEPLASQADNFAGFPDGRAASIPVTIGELRLAKSLTAAQ